MGRQPFLITNHLGKRFGKLVVTGFDHDEYTGNHVYHFMKCHCDCGNDTTAELQRLIRGDRTSCGCSRRFDASRFIGNRYGMLTVICYDHQEGKKHFLRCKCDCGNEAIVTSANLERGHTKSCGCKKYLNATKYVGQKFGRLTIIAHDHDERKSGQIYHMMRCRCECGKETLVNIQALLTGTTVSCGCYNREVVTTHGLSQTRLYNIWDSMKRRCHNPNKDNYKLYGGRGIRVCDEWRNDFKTFYDWAIANGYTDDTTIDRIDPDGDYEPGNCRWVGADVQARNIRHNVYLSYKYKVHGKKKPKYFTFCITDWGRICGITMQTISYHLKNRRGRTINQILEECYMTGHSTTDREIVIPPEIEKYDDPSKFELSYHD